MEAGTIFISHVEEDADAALRIADGLEEGGYPTWCYERDALPGPSYLLQTARQVEDSAAVVLLISANSLGSNQVTAEVVRAHESGRPFVPVLIGLSHVEFAARQPEWREALGSATSIVLPPAPAGVDAIVPRIRQGLAGLGIGPTEGLQPREPSTFVPSLPAAAGVGARRRLVPIGIAAVAVFFVAVLAAVSVLGGGDEGREVAQNGAASKVSSASTTVAPTTVVAASETTTPASNAPAPAAAGAPVVAAARAPVATAPPATTPPTAPPATSAPVTTVPEPPSSGDGTLTTAAGSYEVLDATLTDEWCPPDGGACLTAGGSDRYLVVTLVPAGDGPVSSSPAFTAEANQSSVSFGSGGAAGAKSVFVDQDVDLVEVVYGMVPEGTAGGGFALSWPGNGPQPLSVL